MLFSRLKKFQNDAASLSKYRAALAALHSLGVDQLVLEQCVPHDVAPEHPNILLVNALQNQRVLGFQDCLRALFTLDSLEIPKEMQSAPDYGAVDRMVAEGRITQADADQFLKGGIDV